MLACTVATVISRRLHPESIYTEPLRRKGIKVEGESDKIGVATQKSVGEIMREPVPPVRENATVRQLADRFLTSTFNYLPVVDETSRLLGMVALHDLKEHLNGGQELNGIIAMDIMRAPPACLTPSQKLSDVLPVLLKSELRNVPVVNSLTEFRLVGAVARAEALGYLSEAISSSQINQS
ncbi:MAG: CBS domain-containing protein, partial [Verrucomicrobiales bacterium]